MNVLPMSAKRSFLLYSIKNAIDNLQHTDFDM